MQSHGGVAPIRESARLAAGAVLSGPAGGIAAGRHVARLTGRGDLVTLAMGGTSTDIALLRGGEPTLTGEKTVGIARVALPALDIHTLGAGGGSIAWVDAGRVLRVGPERAGYDPGPACYGRGGTAPTVTDADLLLGRIDPTGFSGGRMPLDRATAETAIRQEVAEPLALAVELAALGISEIVDENMANAARVHAIESGKDARGRTLVAFGGAAPLHAARMAEKLGLDRVLVPSNAGVGSAVGFLRAPIAYEIVRSQLQRLDAFDAAAANALLTMMRAEAEAIVRRGEPKAPLTVTRSAFMRYRGQGHEIAVPLPVRADPPEEAGQLLAAFETAYRR